MFEYIFLSFSVNVCFITVKLLKHAFLAPLIEYIENYNLLFAIESDIKANYESGILTITFPKEDILKNEKQNIIIK